MTFADNVWRPWLLRTRTPTLRVPKAWAGKPWVCDRCGRARSARGHHKSVSFCQCMAQNDQSHRRRIFVAVDWLDPQAPAERLAMTLDVVRQTPELDYLLVTEQPQEGTAKIASQVALAKIALGADSLYRWMVEWSQGNPPLNVWLGTIVENQQQADERIPHLLRIPAAVRWLCVEPLLGPVMLPKFPWGMANGGIGIGLDGNRHIDWLVIAGAIGPDARPCNIEWIRDLLRQAKAADVPAFVKRVGATTTGLGKYPSTAWAWKDPSGADPAEWPEDIRVRQWPERKM